MAKLNPAPSYPTIVGTDHDDDDDDFRYTRPAKK